MRIKTFGTWLQETRKARGISRDELALRIGALPHVIEAIEHDTAAAARAFPRPTVLLLARVLGVHREEALYAAGYIVHPGDAANNAEIDDALLAEMVKVSARYLARIRAGTVVTDGDPGPDVSVDTLVVEVRGEMERRLRAVRCALMGAPSDRERERLCDLERVLLGCIVKLMRV